MYSMLLRTNYGMFCSSGIGGGNTPGWKCVTYLSNVLLDILGIGISSSFCVGFHPPIVALNSESIDCFNNPIDMHSTFWIFSSIAHRLSSSRSRGLPFLDSMALPRRLFLTILCKCALLKWYFLAISATLSKWSMTELTIHNFCSLVAVTSRKSISPRISLSLEL